MNFPNQSLTWVGEYNKKEKKNGKWIAFFQEILMNVGGQSQIILHIPYYKQGQKQGLWIDLYQNYSNSEQILETGEYDKDFRIGKWNYIFEDARIGGGIYQDFSQKQGKWIELVEGFNNYKNVTHNGEYNMQGMKIGRWDCMYSLPNEKEYKQIGGGQYDQDGNQKKIGKWVELDEGFSIIKQVTYNGEYNMKGMKIGRWDSMYCKVGSNEYKLIGGGSYDQDGKQKKIGKWVELDEGFKLFQDVTYNGEYNMQGLKIGRWDSLYCKVGRDEYKQIGGGSYDQDGNQKKIGKWVELDEGLMLRNKSLIKVNIICKV